MSLYPHLIDKNFLADLDRLKIRVQYVKITLLDFKENPIKEIQGTVTDGNITVDGSAAIRRTINLTMLASYENSDLENLDNELSINKKIKVEVGYKNLLKKLYPDYDDILWFPCGTYLISTANLSRTTSNWQISLTGKDKMVLLDGTVGGMFPACVEIKNEEHTIFELIQETVHQWGEEELNNIIINDVPLTQRCPVIYNGDRPIYFVDYKGKNYYTFDDMNYDYLHKSFEKGQYMGYKLVPFVYPTESELVFNAGQSVIDFLNKIVTVLGNYEFFYDLEGHFVFQEKRNFLNNKSRNLVNLTEEDYFRVYTQELFEYALTDMETVTSFSKNPLYDNIKNDYIVWGQRKSGKETFPIRYHLAIDTKPKPALALQYMHLLYQKDNNALRACWFTDSNSPGDTSEYPQTKYEVLTDKPVNKNHIIQIAGESTYDAIAWREELYRQAMQASAVGSIATRYDLELIAEWRKIYTPNDTNDKSDPNKIWNIDMSKGLDSLDYWLDIIDTSTAIGQYSINMIGKRSKIITENSLKTIFPSTIPDSLVIFQEDALTQEEIDYSTNGYNIFNLNDYSYWGPNPDGEPIEVSLSGLIPNCFDKIRDLLYLHLNYNNSIKVSCLPKFYLEPNTILYIADQATNTIGNFMITQYTLPLAYSGMMDISATEIKNKV